MSLSSVLVVCALVCSYRDSGDAPIQQYDACEHPSSDSRDTFQFFATPSSKLPWRSIPIPDCRWKPPRNVPFLVLFRDGTNFEV